MGLIENGANPDRRVNGAPSARMMIPETIYALEAEQTQRMRGYLFLDGFFKGLIPDSDLAGCLLTDWEVAQVAERLLFSGRDVAVRDDLRRNGAKVSMRKP